MKISRKHFLKTMGLASLASTAPALGWAGTRKNPITAHQLRIGLASYTLRRYSLDEVITICLRLGLKDVSLKSFHLPYEDSPEQLQATIAKLKARGLNPYGCGVIYMKKPEDVETYFNYAKNAGLPMIIGSAAHELLPLVEKKVKETDIKLAIHNHGPEDDVFPSPGSVYEKIKHLDPRIGLCIDLGHTFRLKQDPAAELKKYKDRLYDVHIKDINEAIPDGKPMELGRGKMDLPAILAALEEIQYPGVVAIEYEKDGEEAVYGLSESVGYIRGILRMMDA